jgi:hypothetical protein
MGTHSLHSCYSSLYQSHSSALCKSAGLEMGVLRALRGSISGSVDPQGFFNPDILLVGREREEYLG